MSIMSIWDLLFVLFSTGFLFGVLKAWNKRIYFLAYVIIILFAILLTLFGGEAVSSNLEWWQWLIGIADFIVGIELGQLAYEVYWKNDESGDLP